MTAACLAGLIRMLNAAGQIDSADSINCLRKNQDEGRQGLLRQTENHVGTGVWHHQGSDGFSPVLVAGPGGGEGEWRLVCLAFNRKRLFVLQQGVTAS